jgi:hypothetical protein
MENINRIKVEDYNGNDIVEIKLSVNLLISDVVETSEYNIADLDEDEKGIYMRIQLARVVDVVIQEQK